MDCLESSKPCPNTVHSFNSLHHTSTLTLGCLLKAQHVNQLSSSASLNVCTGWNLNMGGKIYLCQLHQQHTILLSTISSNLLCELSSLFMIFYSHLIEFILNHLHGFIHSFIPPFIHSFMHTFIHSFFHSIPFINFHFNLGINKLQNMLSYFYSSQQQLYKFTVWCISSFYVDILQSCLTSSPFVLHSENQTTEFNHYLCNFIRLLKRRGKNKIKVYLL